jgi:hypothetical protein
VYYGHVVQIKREGNKMGKELVISGKIIKGQLVKIEVKTTDKQQIGGKQNG